MYQSYSKVIRFSTTNILRRSTCSRYFPLLDLLLQSGCILAVVCTQSLQKQMCQMPYTSFTKEPFKVQYNKLLRGQKICYSLCYYWQYLYACSRSRDHGSSRLKTREVGMVIDPAKYYLFVRRTCTNNVFAELTTWLQKIGRTSVNFCQITVNTLSDWTQHRQGLCIEVK